MAAHLIRRADTFSPADAEKGRGRRSAPSLPENPTSVQIFKEHILTDIGGAAKMDSNKTLPIFTD
jgi:hypothetical protein